MLTTQTTENEAALTREDARLILAVARDAIVAQFEDAAYHPPVLPAPWNRAGSVFVTLRSPSGTLRGCIGRTAPVFATIAEEISDCAVASATRDTRVPPVARAEMADLNIEVSILGRPEKVSDVKQLDPRRFGVIVSHGTRRGVLLPDIEGVDTVAEQIAIAAGKGGVSLSDPHAIERFEVVKVKADAAPSPR